MNGRMTKVLDTTISLHGDQSCRKTDEFGEVSPDSINPVTYMGSSRFHKL
jgi:hypothetical protein